MSDRTKYKSSIKNWLIRSFGWWPHRAKEFVESHPELLDALRSEGFSNFDAAKYIHENHNSHAQ